MKIIAMILVTSCITACSTVGGAISGAGEDLQKAGEWVKSSVKDSK